MRITPAAVQVMAAFRVDLHRPVCGADILRMYPEMQTGLVYPMLLRWERAGLVTSAMESAAGADLRRPLRRYYTLTGLGVSQYSRMMASGHLTAEHVAYARQRAAEAAARPYELVGHRLVVEGEVEVDVEDGGKAKILHVDNGDALDDGVFVRVQSWSDEGDHAALDEFVGQRLRVTIEVLTSAAAQG